jgi:phage gpG-like protein
MMTPDEVVAYLEAIRDKAAKAAPACALAMGKVHQDYVQNVTLTRFQSVPVSQTPSPPGAPPASMTGTLRRSITCTRGAGGGMHASAVVGPHTIYAATQEWGDEDRRGNPRMWLWLHYIGPYEVKRRGWVKERVKIPARPYMRPSRDDVIANGSVQAAGSAAFMREVFG